MSHRLLKSYSSIEDILIIENLSPLQLGNGYYKYDDESEKVTKIGNLEKEEEWVTKIGRTTDVTSVLVDIFEALFNAGEGGSYPETQVWCLPSGGNFGLPGDVGAMVSNIENECVGLLFGTSIGGEAGVLTPFKLLVDDVFETTGGKLTLMT